MKYVKDYNCWCTIGMTDAIVVNGIAIEIPKDWKSVWIVFMDMFAPYGKRHWVKWCFFDIMISLIHEESEWRKKK